MKHGVKYEKNAIQSYTDLNRKVIIYYFGIILDKKASYIACSPDGLVGRVIEVKCPFKRRNSNPVDEFKQQNLIYIDQNEYLIKDHDCFYQIQEILHITKRQWCDFVIWI